LGQLGRGLEVPIDLRGRAALGLVAPDVLQLLQDLPEPVVVMDIGRGHAPREVGDFLEAHRALLW